MNASSNTPNRSWYRTWFNSRYYHLLYRDRDEEEARIFIQKLISYLGPDLEDHFLDLACGKGRHSRTIAKLGFRVTGADLSEENIKAAKKHENDRLKFIRHDMREAIGIESFNYVVNLFTSFGYFETIEENEAVLDAIYKELKPKGKVVIDFLNVHQVVSGLVPSEERVIDGVKFNISREVDGESILKKIRIDDGGKTMEYEERVKALSKMDFIGMFHRRNLEIIDTFGNYHLDKFDVSESPRLIIIGRKP